MLINSTERNYELKCRRRVIKKLAILICAAPFISSCNRYFQSSKMHRVGYLSSAGFPEIATAFTQELYNLGFREGKNIIIEKRFIRPNTIDNSIMATELLKLDLTLIVVTSLPLALEVRKANPDMPMVIGTCPGMVSNGFAESLERPGGIYTGMDELPPGVTSKRLQLLKKTVPAVTRVALLSTTPGKGGHETQLSEATTTAAELGIEVKPYRANSLAQLELALQTISDEKMNGLLCFQGGLSVVNRKLIADFAAQKQIPAIYQATLFAEAGGLMSWAPDLLQQFREAAHYVMQILNGAKPGDLPIKRPEKYYLTLNLSAAKKMGLTFPPDIMIQATRVL
ncbi:ABC transporter substrate-binding protein [Hymenobacter sp.]|uniref:ABC transporter substrate-binding protein n=1 Tax=Hymenobacter sp. TaxID=1898978 RepID=UPI00286C5170|nr:ABC transporter substrate-binding protein [Hymenobacter sp.]